MSRTMGTTSLEEREVMAIEDFKEEVAQVLSRGAAERLELSLDHLAVALCPKTGESVPDAVTAVLRGLASEKSVDKIRRQHNRRCLSVADRVGRMPHGPARNALAVRTSELVGASEDDVLNVAQLAELAYLEDALR